MSKWLSIENKANKTAKITISGFIGPKYWVDDDGTSKEEVKAELDEITKIKADVIDVEIDSYGGDVNHGFAIYNALKSHPATVNVDFTGWCASIATVIGMAGDTRKAPDNSFLLIHEARSWAMGVKSTIQSMADFLEKINDKITDIYVNVSGSTKETITELMSRDGGDGEWMTAEEMKQLGILTEVYQPLQAAASYDPKVFAEYKLPEIDKSKIKNIMSKDKDDKSLMAKAAELFNWKNDEALKAENEIFKTDIEAFKNTIAENKVALEAVQAELATANESITVLTAEKENETNALNATIDEKQTSIDALESEIAQMKASAIDPPATDPVLDGELTAEQKSFEEDFKKMAAHANGE